MLECNIKNGVIMEDSVDYRRGWHFEDFKVGMRFVSVGRTITEADVVAFAALSGDYNQIHTDVEYSRSTPFGQRVAHGLLILSIASGLAMRTGVLEGTVLAFREINEWKFNKPVFIGDTVNVTMSIKETKAIPRIKGGSVTIEAVVNNQKDELLMKGLWMVLVACRSNGKIKNV